MQTQDIVENWRREAVQEGIEKGLEAGVKQGLEAGVKQGVTRSLIGLYEARFGALPDDVRGIIDDTHDEATLDGWVKLAGTRSADEVAAAIRAARPA
jgi:flagellar biosynthesis/type III secretory pathway protein FliH